MKKILLSSLVVMASHLVVGTAYAAKFRTIPAMAAAPARALAEAAAEVIKNEGVFGDAGAVGSYKFTRSATEQDLNTIKQLNFAKGGLNSDDTGAELMQDATAEQLADHLIDAVSNGDNEDALDAARASLAEALKAVKADASLKIYGTNHADEDGSWQILNVYDPARKEILFIKIGYYGT